VGYTRLVGSGRIATVEYKPMPLSHKYLAKEKTMLVIGLLKRWLVRIGENVKKYFILEIT